MKLNDLDNKNYAKKALKESFGMDFDVSKLNKAQTRTFLNKVQKLVTEAKRTANFNQTHENPAYMKLVFMEQSLRQHMKVAKSPRIIYENEEVQKSQVILAAQDMVDTIQGMFEDVNDMLVKELPALSDSIQSEIGVNESQAYNEQVSQALTTLNAAMQEATNSLRNALGGLTGQGGGEFGASDDLDMDDDMGMDMDMDIDSDIEGGDDAMDLPPIPDMDDEDEMVGQVGRARR